MSGETHLHRVGRQQISALTVGLHSSRTPVVTCERGGRIRQRRQIFESIGAAVVILISLTGCRPTSHQFAKGRWVWAIPSATQLCPALWPHINSPPKVPTRRRSDDTDVTARGSGASLRFGVDKSDGRQKSEGSGAKGKSKSADISGNCRVS